MKRHSISEIKGGEKPAYIANGLIGFRIGPIPMLRGTALVNSFVGLSGERRSEMIEDAPYPLGADIQINGTSLRSRPDLVKLESQTVDFSCGEVESHFSFSVGDAIAKVQMITFCSRTQPALGVQETVVTVNKPVNFVFQTSIDRQGLPGKLKSRYVPREHDAIVEWEGNGELSSVGVATISEFEGEDLGARVRNDYGHEIDLEITLYRVSAKPGKRYVFRQYGAMVPSIMHGEPHWQAARQTGMGRWLGFEKLRQQNREEWEELWKGRPRLIGAEPKWQDVVDAAYFYLHSSVSPSSPCSVFPFGLSARGYGGHVFWDADTFAYHPVLLTAPETARAMMDYRSRGLEWAKYNAKLNGGRGVMYPWQTGSHGWEITPYHCGEGTGGIDEIHMNMNVAFAMAQYVHLTDDDIFFRQQAWPVIEGVARWITSRVTKTKRGYEILHVTGIEEWIHDIHNDAETNMVAVVVLREAIGFAKRLGMKAPAIWKEIADKMYFPVDPKTKVMRKHDSDEYNGGMCVPSPLIGYFPFGYSHSAEVDEATLKYYCDLATTYLGFPMVSAPMGVFAARRGDRASALRFFELGILAFVDKPFMQFVETAKALDCPFSYTGDTVFLGNAAGFLMAVMYGLTGMRLDSGEPENWFKHPTIMPEGWEGVEVERLWIRDVPMRLSAYHGKKAELIKL